MSKSVNFKFQKIFKCQTSNSFKPKSSKTLRLSSCALSNLTTTPSTVSSLELAIWIPPCNKSSHGAMKRLTRLTTPRTKPNYQTRSGRWAELTAPSHKTTTGNLNKQVKANSYSIISNLTRLTSTRKSCINKRSIKRTKVEISRPIKNSKNFKNKL